MKYYVLGVLLVVSGYTCAMQRTLSAIKSSPAKVKAWYTNTTAAADEWINQRVLDALYPESEEESSDEFIDIAEQSDEREEQAEIEDLPYDGIPRQEKIRGALLRLFAAIEFDDWAQFRSELHEGIIPSWYRDLDLDAIDIIYQGELVNAGQLLDQLAQTTMLGCEVQYEIDSSGRRYRMIEEIGELMNQSEDFMTVVLRIARHLALPALSYNPFTQIFDENGVSFGDIIEEKSTSWNPLYQTLGTYAKQVYGDDWERYKRERDQEMQPDKVLSQAQRKLLWKQFKRRVQLLASLDPFQELVANNGKSFGEFLEEHDSVWSPKAKVVASLLKRELPHWEQMKAKVNPVLYPAVYIPHGQLLVDRQSDEENEQEEMLADSEDAGEESDEVLHDEDQDVQKESSLEAAGVKEESFFSSSTTKHIIGAAIGIALGIVIKRYLSEADTQKTTTTPGRSEREAGKSE